MSRKGYHLRKRWVSIRNLKNPNTVEQIQQLFLSAGLLGQCNDLGFPSAENVADRIRRQGVGVSLVARGIITFFLSNRVPVCGTVEAYFRRLYS